MSARDTRHLFILNPAAGQNGNGGARAISDRIDTLMRARDEEHHIVTLGPDDRIADVIRAHTGDGDWRVYLRGGDGTMNQALPAVAGRDHVAVTTLPGGTGNDFLRTFGKDAERFHDLSALVDGEVRVFDLIAAGPHLALNIASMGFDARVAARAHRYKRLGRRHPRTAYDISVAVNLFQGLHRPYEVTLDKTALPGRYCMLLACNGQYYGGGYRPAPKAVLDDGLLDFVLVSALSRAYFFRHVAHYARGDMEKLGGAVVTVRGHSMTVKALREEPVNLDGEIVQADQMTFSLSPMKLRYIVPRGPRG